MKTISTNSVILVLAISFCIGNGEPIRNHKGHHSVKGRLSGADEVSAHSAQYLAYLEAHLSPVDDIRICGGTLISRNYVLTAKKCLYNTDKVDVYLGVHNIGNTSDQCREHRTSSIYNKQYKYHPTSDLAILKLNSPVNKKTGCIDYAKLPDFSDGKDIYQYKFEHAEVYGWGAVSQEDYDWTSDVLRRLASAYVKAADSDILAVENSYLNRAQLCIGDGGVPLILRGVQIGVARQDYDSLEQCESHDKMYDIFVPVAQRLKWIQDNSDVKIK